MAQRRRRRQGVLAFETSLAKIQWTQVESRDALKTYNKVDFEDLSKDIPGFDWMGWARPQGLDRAVDVVLQQPSFFKGFAAMARRPRRLEGVARRAVLHGLGAVPEQGVRGRQLRVLRTTISGQPAQRDHAGSAAWASSTACWARAWASSYVEKHFPPEAKARMDRMVANLIEAYRQAHPSLDWMRPATRRRRWPSWPRSARRSAIRRSGATIRRLKIRRDDLVGNVQRAATFEWNRSSAKLGKPVDRDEWHMTPQTVNAYYNPRMNEIVFPAANLAAAVLQSRAPTTR